MVIHTSPPIICKLLLLLSFILTSVSTACAGTLQVPCMYLDQCHGHAENGKPFPEWVIIELSAIIQVPRGPFCI